MSSATLYRSCPKRWSYRGRASCDHRVYFLQLGHKEKGIGVKGEIGREKYHLFNGRSNFERRWWLEKRTGKKNKRVQGICIIQNICESAATFTLPSDASYVCEISFSWTLSSLQKIFDKYEVHYPIVNKFVLLKIMLKKESLTRIHISVCSKMLQLPTAYTNNRAKVTVGSTYWFKYCSIVHLIFFLGHAILFNKSLQ